jgi:flavin reductase ActVB
VPNHVMADSDFRKAMSRFASGVTIVTSVDDQGRPHGFTASAFCSLSAEPPLVLVCLDRDARCHPTFMRAPTFAVSILRDDHVDAAMRFASSSETDKFAAGDLAPTEHGPSRLPDALAALTCQTHQRLPIGDHTVLVGRVLDARIGEGEPVVFYDRQFRSLSEEQR